MTIVMILYVWTDEFQCILIDDTTWGQIVELAVSLGVETRIE